MTRRILATIAILAALAGGVAQADTTAPATPGSSATPEMTLTQVLTEALGDERKARATYEAVLEKFGDVRPFSNIVQAEQRHAEHLLPLFERYDVPVPENLWKAESIEVPASLSDSCRLAVEAEESNVAMYDLLLASVTQEDVRGTLEMLRARSLERHLPAFERCAEGRGRRGGGGGKGHGRGQGCGFCSKAD